MQDLRMRWLRSPESRYLVTEETKSIIPVEEKEVKAWIFNLMGKAP